MFDKIIELFALKLQESGIPLSAEDNAARLNELEAKLPKRLPQSFGSFLSRYSFPEFSVGELSLFGWQSAANGYSVEASASKGSLSELLLPAGLVQIGRPDGGSFDAICFDTKDQQQNREYRIVRVDHEEILCNWRVVVTDEMWPSFRVLVEGVLAGAECQIFYEGPDA